MCCLCICLFMKQRVVQSLEYLSVNQAKSCRKLRICMKTRILGAYFVLGLTFRIEHLYMVIKVQGQRSWMVILVWIIIDCSKVKFSGLEEASLYLNFFCDLTIMRKFKYESKVNFTDLWKLCNPIISQNRLPLFFSLKYFTYDFMIFLLTRF